jgi:putative transposase
MSRLSRVVLPGIPHHVTQRGNRRQKTFFNADDYRAYIALLAAASRRHDSEVWAWCLMPNHVHLIITPATPDGLRASLGEAHRRYTRRINFREGWRGHLWQERFHSFPMDESHLLAALRYVELNPVKAGLVEHAPDWPWSSARARLTSANDGLTHPTALDGLVTDWPAFWTDTPDAADTGDLLRRHSRTGRPLGNEAFIRTAERLTGRTLRPQKPGPRPQRSRVSNRHEPSSLRR